MREILFRGKRVDNCEWVEGFYLEDRWGDSNNSELHGILRDRTCPSGLADWSPTPVQKETVGQYTDLVDKNGKKIFEGDIVKNKQNYVYTVSYDECGFKIEEAFGNRIKMVQDGITRLGVEVIGNIHDNPELLEEESK